MMIFLTKQLSLKKTRKKKKQRNQTLKTAKRRKRNLEGRKRKLSQKIFRWKKFPKEAEEGGEGQGRGRATGVKGRAKGSAGRAKKKTMLDFDDDDDDDDVIGNAHLPSDHSDDNEPNPRGILRKSKTSGGLRF